MQTHELKKKIERRDSIQFTLFFWRAVNLFGIPLSERCWSLPKSGVLFLSLTFGKCLTTNTRHLILQFLVQMTHTLQLCICICADFILRWKYFFSTFNSIVVHSLSIRIFHFFVKHAAISKDKLWHWIEHLIKENMFVLLVVAVSLLVGRPDAVACTKRKPLSNSDEHVLCRTFCYELFFPFDISLVTFKLFLTRLHPVVLICFRFFLKEQ